VNGESRDDALPLGIEVPPGDHPAVVEHFANRLLQIVADALTDLDTVLSVHSESAPTSASHLYRYLSIVAGETLGCLKAWPS